MTKKTIGPIHTKCRKIRHESPILRCDKSPEHVDSKDPERQWHFDSNNEVYWNDAGEEREADG